MINELGKEDLKLGSIMVAKADGKKEILQVRNRPGHNFGSVIRSKKKLNSIAAY